jgi:hypothetical protein
MTGLAPGTRIAGYLLDEQVGAGGIAVVFRARDERLERWVALKVVPSPAGEELRQRFLRPALATAAIDDPHVIPVYEAGEADGALFVAMRYVAGGDVGSLVRRDGALSPGAGGRRHLVRRRRAGHGARGGQPVGTLDYSAPEQLAGEDADGSVDQYALACAAYELLTGAPPFPRQQVTAMIWAHMSQPPPRLTSRRPDLPPAVDAVLFRALAKAPGDRYRRCGEFADQLGAALALRPGGPGREPAAALRLAPARRSYPPAMPGYPPAMPGYPPAMPGYPPAMPGYPPVMPGPPPAAGAPAGSGTAGQRDVAALAFSLDGSILAVSAPGGRACLRDMATGRMTAALASPGAGSNSGPGGPGGPARRRSRRWLSAPTASCWPPPTRPAAPPSGRPESRASSPCCPSPRAAACPAPRSARTA